MTVSTQQQKVIANGNGAATVFSFSPVTIYEDTDLVVVLTNSSGIQTTLTEGVGSSNYSLSVSAYPGTGSITYPATGGTPVPLGSTLTMYSAIPPTQDVALNNQGGYFPEVQEGALDKLTLLIQQILRDSTRGIKINLADAAVPVDLPVAALRANQALVFDSSGNPIAGAIPSVVVSAAMQDVFQAVSHASAKTILGLATVASTGAYSDLAGSPPVLRGFIGGLTLSNDGATPNTKIDVSAGMCVEDTNTKLLVLAAGAIDCTTTGVNGLDAGALATSTWYHVFAISNGGTTACLASTSLTPTMPGGYTLKRRIGSFKTNSSAHILAFKQSGDEFVWNTAAPDVNNVAAPASDTLYAVSVPPGVVTKYNFLAALDPNGATGLNIGFFSSFGGTTVIGLWAAGAGTAAEGQFSIFADTSQHIHAAASGGQAGDTFSLLGVSYTDTRGRFA